MAIGIAAALSAAAAWAVASALIAQWATRVDAFSLSFIRAVWALLFLFAAGAILGPDSYSRMSASDIAQLAAAGFLATGLAQTLYAATIPILGLNTTFIITTGGTVVFAYVFGALFIDDPVTWQDGAGSTLIIGGVFAVAIYGRRREPALQRASTPTAGWFSQARALLDRPPPIAGGSLLSDGRPATTTLRRAPAAPSAWTPAHSRAIGLVLAIAMAALWGAATVWIRDAAAGFDAAAAVSVRMPFVVLFLLVLALSQPHSDLRRRALPRRSHLPLALSGILGTGVTGLFIVISLHNIGAGSFTVLFSTAPLFGMLLAALFLGERITVWLLIGALLIVGGIALIA